MKRFFLIGLMVVLFLSACSAPSTAEPASPPAPSPVEPTATSAPPTAQPSATPALITITDALGREVSLPSAPQRIVITGKAFFMISNAAYAFPEAAERIAGLGKSGQATSGFTALLEPQFDAKAVLESDAGAEAIAALTPDLVILKSYLAETLGASLEALQIPVVYVDFETPEQYLRDLAILGKVFQDEERAAELATFYQERVDVIQAAVADAPEKPRTLLLSYSDRDGNVAFSVPPMNWMQTQMVQLAGGEPVWADANPGNGWATVTLEQIAAWDADQIFIIAYQGSSSDVVQGLKEDAQWQALRAVQEGHLWAFPADFISWDQPDTRWTLGLAWLAARLHPDAFPEYNAVEDAAAFFQAVYRLDRETFEREIAPKLKGDLP